MSAEAFKPRRSRSGTAAWHMSREAVTLSVTDVAQWDDKKCHEFMVEVRWKLCNDSPIHPFRGRTTRGGGA